MPMKNSKKIFVCEKNFKEWFEVFKYFCREENFRREFFRENDIGASRGLSLVFGKSLSAKEVGAVLKNVSKTHSNTITAIKFYNNAWQKNVSLLKKILKKQLISQLHISEIVCFIDLRRLITIIKKNEGINLHIDKIGAREQELNGSSKELLALLKAKISSMTVRADFLAAHDIFKRFVPLLQKNKKLTSLNLCFSDLGPSAKEFFAAIHFTSLTELNLPFNGIKSSELEFLRHNLRISSIRKLDLSNNLIKDLGLDILAEALRESHVLNLNLSRNEFQGKNNFFKYVHENSLTILDLSFNIIKNEDMFNFPLFLKNSSVSALNFHGCDMHDRLGEKLLSSLRDSSVSTLDISDNKFRIPSFKALANTLKNTKITDLNLDEMEFTTEMLVILGDCLAESHIRKLRLGFMSFSKSVETAHSVEEFLDAEKAFLKFIQQTHKSRIKSLELVKYDRSWPPLISENLAKVMKNLNMEHFRVPYLQLFDNGLYLFSALQTTTITQLQLIGIGLDDNHMRGIAKFLPTCKITKLDMSENCIRSKGAKVLGQCFKTSSLTSLNLGYNLIDDEGVDYLAQLARNTLIYDLNLEGNSTSETMLLESVLLRNQSSVYDLQNFSLLIAPPGTEEFDFKQASENFRPGRSLKNGSLKSFLYETLRFYKIFLDHVSAPALIAEETARTTGEVNRLMSKFPEQFAAFVGGYVEADAFEHVNLLKRCEDMGLTMLVDYMILNRPVFILDKSDGVLHPYVYCHLHRLGMPLWNSTIESGIKEKILQFLKMNSELEMAVFAIRLIEYLY